MKGLLLLVSFCVFHSSWAQIIYRGKCPTPTIQEDFNATLFSGRWFEASRSFALLELSLRCVETNFKAQDDGKLSMGIKGVDVIGENRSYTGRLEIRNTSDPARMKTRFRFLPMSMNYIVLQTDYNSSAVIWSCHNIFGGRMGHLENLWILSRRQHLPAEVKHGLYDMLDERGVKRQFLQSTDQDNCPRSTNDDDEDLPKVTTIVVNNVTTTESPPVSSPKPTVVLITAAPKRSTQSPKENDII